MANSIYYDYSKINSYNALFNFIITERGLGKSFGFKKMVLDNFLKGKGQFMIVRRYEEELKESLKTFWNDIIESGLYDGHEFSMHRGAKIQELFIDGEKCGYGVALSTSSSLKSTPFPEVKSIGFDEFIIDKGSVRYLKNEVEAFLDLFETVNRTRSDCKAYFMGNAISSTNPYFNYDWGDGEKLSLPYGNSEFKRFKNGLIVVNYAKNSAYREEKKKTPFGQLISGTKYGDYAINNEWLRESKAFIGRKDGSAKHWSVVVIGGDKYGVWLGKGWNTWVSKDFDPSCPVVFSFTSQDHDENTILVNARKSFAFALVISSYRRGTLHFESQEIKNAVMPWIEKCLTY